MTEFATLPPKVVPADPTKHVNYTLGMVLGVDDFTQEFEYLADRDRRTARETIGYGTLWGLAVSADEDEARGRRLMVAPGSALDRCGQPVCVAPAQCLYLNEWLDANEAEIRRRGLVTGAKFTVAAYVVLGYRDCPTDSVPIPGEPCRSEDDLTAPSRLRDDFRLELRLDAPLQFEEDAVRDFVAWLRAIPVVDSGGSEVHELIGEICKAAKAALEAPLDPENPPPAPLDFLTGTPPHGLAIERDDVCGHLAAAFRLWDLELRPLLRRLPRGGDCGCPGGGADDGDGAILLAAVELPLAEASGDLEVRGAASAPIGIDESRRPSLVHLRMLQEWLLCGGGGAQGPPGKDGAPGKNGKNGKDGADGKDGKEGPAGKDGAPGKDGATGKDGKDGKPGKDGARGPQGPPGETHLVGAGRWDGERQTWAIGGMRIEAPEPPVYALAIKGFKRDAKYSVTGAAFADREVPGPYVIQQVHEPSDFGDLPASDFLFVTVFDAQRNPPPHGFVIEVRDFTDEAVGR